MVGPCHAASHRVSTEQMLTSTMFWLSSEIIPIKKVILLEHALSQIKVRRLQVSGTELRTTRVQIVFYTPT